MKRSDRKIAWALVGTITVASLAIVWMGNNRTSTDDTEADSATIARFQRGMHEGYRSHSGYYSSKDYHSGGNGYATAASAFPFDPNTADSSTLLELGLRPWQVKNIMKYRRHGGVYRRKEDFARLYGLTVKEYRRLEPYICIGNDYQPAATLLKEQRDTLRHSFKLSQGEHVILNTADTAELMRVPGIGSYFARQIVRHGQWLGGYVSVDQLDEIDQFPQNAKQFFVIEAPHPQKLNVNRLTLAQLRRHPYISFYQAKAIVDYRRLRGDIKNIRDLRLSKAFTDADFLRLEPYMEY